MTWFRAQSVPFIAAISHGEEWEVRCHRPASWFLLSARWMRRIHRAAEQRLRVDSSPSAGVAGSVYRARSSIRCGEQGGDGPHAQGIQTEGMPVSKSPAWGGLMDADRRRPISAAQEGSPKQRIDRRSTIGIAQPEDETLTVHTVHDPVGETCDTATHRCRSMRRVPSILGGRVVSAGSRPAGLGVSGRWMSESTCRWMRPVSGPIG